MKTKTIISDINFEDLVDLFSTALYGSQKFGAYYNKSDYEKCTDKKDGDCYEDKLARILLNGGTVVVFDLYAEMDEDFYGDLPHKWNEKHEVMDYTVSIKDIEVGIQKAIDNGGWSAECARDLVNHEDGNLVLQEAEEVMQWILFGESIY